jgi:protein arginine kinase activator
MKCHKCSKQAVVHLTEIVNDGDAIMGEGSKRAVEIHLCLSHAVEAGLIVPGPEVPPAPVEQYGGAGSGSGGASGGEQQAIVPAEPAELAVRTSKPTDQCAYCGMSWAHFKQGGLMGCAHDYEMFSAKMLPLLKRAQEGATAHIGKVPRRRKSPDAERHVASLRLRKELQKAVDAENYEEAAQLRDQLRRLEQN